MTVTLGLIFVASLRKAWPRTFLAVRCLHCPRAQIVHRGTTARGTPRSLCQPTRCPQGSVRRASAHRGGVPAVQPTMLDMRLHARGGRDTARSLPRCPTPGRRALQQKAAVREAGNTAVLRPLHRAAVAWDGEGAGAAEAAREALGSLVGPTGHPRWRGQAIAPPPRQGLRLRLGAPHRRGLWAAPSAAGALGAPPFLHRFWGASTRHLAPDVPSPGTRHPQKRERQHLTVRTRRKRLARKTLGFATTPQRHDLVLGFFVTRYVVGRAV